MAITNKLGYIIQRIFSTSFIHEAASTWQVYSIFPLKIWSRSANLSPDHDQATSFRSLRSAKNVSQHLLSRFDARYGSEPMPKVLWETSTSSNTSSKLALVATQEYAVSQSPVEIHRTTLWIEETSPATERSTRTMVHGIH
jgi:hypothetical protein